LTLSSVKLIFLCLIMKGSNSLETLFKNVSCKIFGQCVLAALCLSVSELHGQVAFKNRPCYMWHILAEFTDSHCRVGWGSETDPVTCGTSYQSSRTVTAVLGGVRKCEYMWIHLFVVSFFPPEKSFLLSN
jgi:hypothetical protein